MLVCRGLPGHFSRVKSSKYSGGKKAKLRREKTYAFKCEKGSVSVCRSYPAAFSAERGGVSSLDNIRRPSLSSDVRSFVWMDGDGRAVWPCGVAFLAVSLPVVAYSRCILSCGLPLIWPQIR